MRSTLPSRSPTVVLIWHSAMRRRAMGPADGPKPEGWGRLPGGTRRLDGAEWGGQGAARAAARPARARLDGGLVERLGAEPDLAEATVALAAASRSAIRLVDSDPAAVDVLADLDAPVPGGADAAA